MQLRSLIEFRDDCFNSTDFPVSLKWKIEKNKEVPVWEVKTY